MKISQSEIVIPDPSPREIRDAAFYRKQAKALQKKLDEAEHLLEEISGLRSVQSPPIVWKRNEHSSIRTHSTIIAHTSDVHYGEIIKAGEIDGLNEFNPEICAERIRKFFQATCEIGPRWVADGICDGVLLTMAGDLISGDIHEELRITNAMTSHDQLAEIVEIYSAGIRLLLDAYPKVHVVVTPGNHGRTTMKPTAKLVSRLNYDILIGRILSDRWRDNDLVTFQIAEGTDVRISLYNRNILVTHGDKIGTGGGLGFAGPVLPILRGTNKIHLQNGSAGRDLIDLILMGHFHRSAAPPGVLSNGSVAGYSEFANAIRASVEEPRQWLARFSESWGLCERNDIRL